MNATTEQALVTLALKEEIGNGRVMSVTRRNDLMAQIMPGTSIDGLWCSSVVEVWLGESKAFVEGGSPVKLYISHRLVLLVHRASNDGNDLRHRFGFVHSSLARLGELLKLGIAEPRRRQRRTGLAHALLYVLPVGGLRDPVVHVDPSIVQSLLVLATVGTSLARSGRVGSTGAERSFQAPGT